MPAGTLCHPAFCLSMQWYARYVDPFGASRLKELIFTARLLSAQEALAAGFVHEIVAPKRSRPACANSPRHRLARADDAVGDEGGVRRIQEARLVPNGDDLIARTYGSANFKEGARLLDKRPPRWTGS